MIPSSYPTAEEMARLTARMLLEVKAVHFNADEPFTLASGLPSPTYIDCRKVISFPRVRSALMDFMCQTLSRDAGFEAFDNIAGGETRSEEHTSELQSLTNLVCRLLLEKKKQNRHTIQLPNHQHTVTAQHHSTN